MMIAKRISRISLLTALFCLLSLPAQAAIEAGRILFARGTVSIVDAQNSARGGSVGSVFYEGDRIVTGNNSIAQLRLSDGALTALRSHSDYQIERQRFDEAGQVYEQAGRLVAGWMRSVTGAIGARYPGNVKQGTSVATIGIRGTTYQIIHVPDEGLPEFPNLPPGTYVYLESGQVEVTNEAGSRIINPGQVVRISGPRIEPELVPELVEMFQSQLLASLEGGVDDSFSVREVLNNQTDSLIGGTVFAPPFTRSVSALSLCNSACFAALEPVDVATGVGGSGAGRFLQEVLLGGGDAVLVGIVGRSPVRTGYYAVTADGELASQIHWGTWLEGDYLINGIQSGVEDGDWRYIMGDSMLGDDLAVGSLADSIGLVGTVKYFYEGGSGFRATDINGLSAGSINMRDSSFLEISFGQLTVAALLDMSNGDSLFGSGSLSSLFSGGLTLSGTSVTEQSLSGTLSGAFSGGELEAVATMMDYVNLSSSFTYEGVAIFERDELVYGGVSGFTTASPSTGVINPNSVEIGGISGSVFPLVADVDTGFSRYQLAALTSVPSELTGSYTVFNNMDGVASNVYWGIWDTTSYSATNTSSSAPVLDTPTADWHYMIASNPLSESMVSNIGLTGTYTYNYVGGTPLRDVQGVLTDMVISASTINVDFSSLSSQSAISVSMDIGNFTGMTGAGSLSDLYDGGINFAHTSGLADGAIIGTFAGSNAEALLGAISYNESTASFVGTALYEQSVSVP